MRLRVYLSCPGCVQIRSRDTCTASRTEIRFSLISFPSSSAVNSEIPILISSISLLGPCHASRYAIDIVYSPPAFCEKWKLFLRDI